VATSAVAEHPHEGGAEEKGKSDAEHTHGKRTAAHAEEVRRPRLQADEEEQNDHAEFGEEVVDERDRLLRCGAVAVEQLDQRGVGGAY